MPKMPPPQCDAYGCKAPAQPHSRHCIEHQVRTRQPPREDQGPYKTAAWSRIRTAQLTAQPLCQACLIEGRTTAAEHVDHLFAWRAVGPGAFRQNTFQSLCQAHHGVKTGLEQRGVFRHYAASGVVDYGLSDYSRVCG